MNTPEVLVITLLGVACGCQVSAGFLMQMAYVVWIKDGSHTTKFLFQVVRVIVGVSCGIAPVFVLMLIVMGMGWEWVKFWYFAIVTVLTVALTMYGFNKISSKINPLISNV